MNSSVDYELRTISRRLCGIRDALACEGTGQHIKALAEVKRIRTALNHLEEELITEITKGGGSNGKDRTTKSTD